MDDFDFLDDDILDEEDLDFNDLPLDDEFIRTHFNTIPDNGVIENFPFVEDDIDAITDYELFSKGFTYLDDKKADKEELSEYVKKDELPPLDDFVTKDTQDLTYYTKTSDLSNVALTGDYDDLLDKPDLFSGDYNDLTNKPTIPTKTSELTNNSGFITNTVNNLTNYTKTSDLSNVALTGDYDDLSNKPTIPVVPTNISSFTNDSGYITKDVNDLTNYTLTSSLSNVATSGSYNDLSNKPNIPPNMTILSYGSSTWNDFITAYNSNSVVYCRASSNSNPATGSQTRLAFMAYVNNSSTPTEVEFQYYRSVSTHSDSQQGDQVFVYKLTSSGTWSVLTRNTFSKVVAGTNLSSSYSNGVITLNNTLTVPTKTSDLTNDSNFLVNSDSGWIYEMNSNDVIMTYRKVNNIVYLICMSKSGNYTLTGGDYTLLFTLPQGYRPSIETTFTIHTFADGKQGMGFIPSDGRVRVYVNQSSTYWGFSVSFPT